MAVTYLIEFDVRPDQRGRFVELLTQVLDAMRSESTFMNATLHVAADDPNRFLLHETWRDHEDVVQVQLQRPYRRAWHDALPTLLAKERTISTWMPLRADRN